jgi:hypothetical protein
MKFQVQFSLLPLDYKPPVGQNLFLKMAKAGEPITFIIVAPTISGYSYWTEDKKCIRSREKPSATPNIKIEDDGKPRVNHFWMIPVYDLNSESFKLLEVTQAKIRDQITAIRDSGFYDIGNLNKPTALQITAQGSGKMTTYNVLAGLKDIPDLMERLEAFEDVDLDEVIFGEVYAAPVDHSANPLADIKPVVPPSQVLDKM